MTEQGTTQPSGGRKSDGNEMRGPSAEHDAAVVSAIRATGRRIRYRRWRRYAAAASVFVAMGLGFILVPGDRNTAPQMRNLADTATPSGYVALASTPELLRWIDERGDAPYTVEMFDRSGAALWTVRDVSATSLALTDDYRLAIEPAGVYFWVVTTASGEELGPYWFLIDDDAH